MEGGYPRPDIVVLRSKLDQKWGAPQGGGNVYAYGNGGPLEGRDPSGLAVKYDAQLLFVSNCWHPTACDFSGGSIWHWGEGFEGGQFDPADLLTDLELTYTGNLVFNSEEAYDTYLALKRAAYNAGGFDFSFANTESRAPLLAMLERAERGMTITIGLFEDPRNLAGGNDILRQIVITTGAVEQTGVRAEVILAHELGHFFLPRVGVPNTIVPTRYPPTNPADLARYRATEYGAFYYEDLARAAFGCPPRLWSHDTTSPACH